MDADGEGLVGRSSRAKLKGCEVYSVETEILVSLKGGDSRVLRLYHGLWVEGGNARRP